MLYIVCLTCLGTTFMYVPNVLFNLIWVKATPCEMHLKKVYGFVGRMEEGNAFIDYSRCGIYKFMCSNTSHLGKENIEEIL